MFQSPRLLLGNQDRRLRRSREKSRKFAGFDSPNRERQSAKKSHQKDRSDQMADNYHCDHRIECARVGSDLEEGKMQYQSSCAACHGIDAKGDGPVSTELKTPPADLTVLAKNNNGTFPYDMVYQVIDGRNSTIPSHGTREMPVWGYRFGPPQAFRFKHHILAVIDYLKSVQRK
jgi:Cytochrome C oxidase, cbb3-type, subunit III